MCHKFKTIKRIEYVSEIKEIEKEIKVPIWYVKFLKWLFKSEEELIDLEILQEKNEAFEKATKIAHSRKEEIMQRKLSELGYEVKFNLQAKEFKENETMDITMFNPNEIWSIEKIN